MKSVTAAIIRTGSKILLTRRAPGEKLAGFCEFPGGKVEDGESLQECLAREILELGVKATAGKIICESAYVCDHGSFNLIAIETTISSQDFTPFVHDRVEWIEVAEILNYQLLPADIPIAQQLARLHCHS